MAVLVYTENWDGKFKKLTYELVSYALEIAKLYHERFNCEVSIMGEEKILKKKVLKNIPHKLIVVKSAISAKKILTQDKKEKPDILLIPSPYNRDPEENSLGIIADNVVKSTLTPVMIIKDKVAKPKKLFSNVLTYVPGNWGAVEEFSISFKLVENGGNLQLLHVIESDTLQNLKNAIEITPGLGSDELGAKIVENFKKEISDLMDEAVLQSKHEPFTVKSHIATGDPSNVCTKFVEAGSSTLMIIKTKHGLKKVEGESYELARAIKIPIVVM